MTANDKAAYSSYVKSNYIHPLDQKSSLVEVVQGRCLQAEIQGLIFAAIEDLIIEHASPIERNIQA